VATELVALCVPNGEVADGELGEALEPGDLDQHGARGRPGGHHG
jgi:hypothetical protein